MILDMKVCQMLYDPEIMEQIELEDISVHTVPPETVYYLKAPKILVEENYPEAEWATIMVVIPGVVHSNWDVMVEISPTKDGSDYDYTLLDLPFDLVEKLLEDVLYLKIKEN